MHRYQKPIVLSAILVAIFLTSCGEGREFNQEDELRLKTTGESWYEDNEPTKEIYELAEADDAAAQSAVGTYLKKINSSLALKMLRESSANGEVESFYQLGIMHFKGYKVDMGGNGLGGIIKLIAVLNSDSAPSDPKNWMISYKQAFNYFEQAAQLGHVQAQNYVGYMLYEGLGVEKNYEKACVWWESASRGGDSTAALNYARCLPQNEKLPLLTLAAEANALAAFELWLHYVTLQELKESEKSIIEFTGKRNPTSEINLELDYESMASYWLSKSADMGYELASLLKQT